MAKLRLTLSIWDYDRTRALADGSVRPDGIELNVLELPKSVKFKDGAKEGLFRPLNTDPVTV